MNPTQPTKSKRLVSPSMIIFNRHRRLRAARFPGKPSPATDLVALAITLVVVAAIAILIIANI